MGGMVKRQHANDQAIKTHLPLAMDGQYIEQLIVDYPWMVQYIDAKDFGIEKSIKAKCSTGHGHGEDMDEAHADMDIEENIFDMFWEETHGAPHSQSSQKTIPCIHHPAARWSMDTAAYWHGI